MPEKERLIREERTHTREWIAWYVRVLTLLVNVTFSSLMKVKERHIYKETHSKNNCYVLATVLQQGRNKPPGRAGKVFHEKIFTTKFPLLFNM